MLVSPLMLEYLNLHVGINPLYATGLFRYPQFSGSFERDQCHEMGSYVLTLKNTLHFSSAYK